jgi:hypothetical protein
LTPRFIFALSLFALSIIITGFIKRVHYKRLAFVLTVGIGVGLYLSKNIPYKVDWNSTGSIVEDVAAAKPIIAYTDSLPGNFEGLVCLALSSCDYCHNMIEDLKKMKKRKPHIDMAIFLYAIDSNEIAASRAQIENSDIHLDFAPDPNNSFRLTYGNFPTIIYIKDNSIKQRWFNNQFGYPARDKVESSSF